MNNFKNKKIAVVGAGVEGLSSEKWLKEKGASVKVLDQKDGDDYLENLDQYDLIVRSPGVKRSILEQALPESSRSSPGGEASKITSQTQLFFDLCPCPIIGVTGTKGKGTTSSLIYEMLKAQGLDAYLGGNIGKPPFEFLDQLKKDSWVVLELSSFQLQDLTKSPHIAVMLMVVSEHLDYHKDVLEYVDAKRNLLRFQNHSDFAILNRDYPASNESDVHTSAKTFWVSRERIVDEGCFVKDGKVVLRISENASVADKNFLGPAIRLSSSENFVSSLHVKEIEIISSKEILLPGKHNLENVCAAVMAATLAGVSKDAIARVLREFKGLEHRLELIGEIRGVRYYDDSFSTTPETAIAAIEAFKEPKILILGGSSKNSDFTELGRVIRDSKSIRAIIGIGEEWERIKASIKYKVSSPSVLSSGSKDIKYIEECKNMRKIAQAAFDAAQPEDVVLLSPACASFGMFKNYKDRGEQFKREVRALNKTQY